MAKPADSQTEKATPKRQLDARKKGNAARSTELPQSVTLVVAIMIFVPVLSATWGRLRADTTDLIVNGYVLDPTRIGSQGRDAMSSALGAIMPMLVLLICVSIVAQLAISGTPNLWKLKPKFDTLNPKNGLKRIFSKQQLWELVRTILKLTFLALVAFVSWSTMGEFLTFGPAPLSSSFGEWRRVLQSLAVGVAILGIFIGLSDAIISKRNFTKGLKMSKQEVKEEMRQAEGDPIIKGQLRQAQHRMSRMRMMAAVADATVVITNPTHLSVALKYEVGDAAPVVVAKGADELAMRIRTEARRHGVPITENRPVARTLYATAEIGEAIPVALYKAVAQLLASIYSASRPLGAGSSPQYGYHAVASRSSAFRS